MMYNYNYIYVHVFVNLDIIKLIYNSVPLPCHFTTTTFHHPKKKNLRAPDATRWRVQKPVTVVDAMVTVVMLTKRVILKF